MSSLAPDIIATTEAQIVCPWCRSSVADAAISLAGLFRAHVAEAIHWAQRGEDGSAGDGLATACSSCGGEFLVAVRSFQRFPAMRLLAIRPAPTAELAGIAQTNDVRREEGS